MVTRTSRRLIDATHYVFFPKHSGALRVEFGFFRNINEGLLDKFNGPSGAHAIPRLDLSKSATLRYRKARGSPSCRGIFRARI
jgi:hypothetical protein